MVYNIYQKSKQKSKSVNKDIHAFTYLEQGEAGDDGEDEVYNSK